MGADIEGAGYQWGRVALATYGPVGGVILAMTNEEWCQEPGRTEAYNEWRRGVIRAHRENPSCELALGATAVRERTWQGERLPDNVCDVATDIWAYLDEVGGWADIHTHVMDANFRLLPARDGPHFAGVPRFLRLESVGVDALPQYPQGRRRGSLYYLGTRRRRHA